MLIHVKWWWLQVKLLDIYGCPSSHLIQKCHKTKRMLHLWQQLDLIQWLINFWTMCTPYCLSSSVCLALYSTTMFMVLSSWQCTATATTRVHPVHLIFVDWIFKGSKSSNHAALLFSRLSHSSLFYALIVPHTVALIKTRAVPNILFVFYSVE